MLDLQGAVAVVTGATRGIGRRTALALGARGARVIVVGRTGIPSENPMLPGSVEETVAELQQLGAEAIGVTADLVDEAATSEIVGKTLAAFGRCDLLVNNAAYTSNGAVLDIPWHRWQRAFRVQVVAPLQLCQGFLPGMIERRSGSVINVSSGASQSMTQGLALYGTSKQAMERWSDFLHQEVVSHGVAVNTLRVDRIVSTEGWHYVARTQGLDVATGGGDMSGVIGPELAAEFVLWIAGRPSGWSGHTVGFEEITALGGPVTPRMGGSAI